MIGIHYIYSNAFHGFQIIPLALFVCLRLDLLVPFELVVVEERLVIFNGDRSRIPGMPLVAVELVYTAEI